MRGLAEDGPHPWARQVVFRQDLATKAITVVDADTTGQATAPITRATTTVYDAGRPVLSFTDAAGRLSTTIYDGRPRRRALAPTASPTGPALPRRPAHTPPSSTRPTTPGGRPRPGRAST